MADNIVEFPRGSRNGREAELNCLVAMSRDILRLAKEGDWAAALELQRRRRERLEFFFEKSPHADEADTVARAIQAILDIDSQLSDIVYAGRRSLMEETGRSRREHLAARAYLAHSE